MFGRKKISEEHKQRMQLIIQVEQYDRTNLQHIIRDIKPLKDAVRPDCIRKGLVKLPSALVEGLLNNKSINPKIVKKLMDAINKKVPADYQNLISQIKVKRLMYHEKEGEKMQLMLEFEKLDLDKFIDTLLKDILQKKSDSGKEQMSVQLLAALNQDISQESKYELIQMFLKWVSDNKVPNTVLMLHLIPADQFGIRYLNLLMLSLNLLWQHLKKLERV